MTKTETAYVLNTVWVVDTGSIDGNRKVIGNVVGAFSSKDKALECIYANSEFRPGDNKHDADWPVFFYATGKTSWWSCTVTEINSVTLL